jgi:hypothetical protein
VLLGLIVKGYCSDFAVYQAIKTTRRHFINSMAGIGMINPKLGISTIKITKGTKHFKVLLLRAEYSSDVMK